MLAELRVSGSDVLAIAPMVKNVYPKKTPPGLIAQYCVMVLTVEGVCLRRKILLIFEVKYQRVTLVVISYYKTIQMMLKDKQNRNKLGLTFFVH